MWLESGDYAILKINSKSFEECIGKAKAEHETTMRKYTKLIHNNFLTKSKHISSIDPQLPKVPNIIINDEIYSEDV